MCREKHYVLLAVPYNPVILGDPVIDETRQQALTDERIRTGIEDWKSTEL